MADSALELYERAYRLQYEERMFAEAAEIYNRIIRDFPESNECGYAVIQLEKMKANQIVDEIESDRRRTNPLVVVSVILNGLVAVMLMVACTTYLGIRKRDREYFSMLSQAIGSMVSGANEAALKTLSDLKFKTSGDIIPYVLSADVYARLGQFAEARAELDKFQKVYPSRSVPAEFFASIEQRRHNSSSVLSARNVVPQVEEEEKLLSSQESVDQPIKEAEPPSRPRPASTTRSKTRASRKSSQDTISFF